MMHGRMLIGMAAALVALAAGDAGTQEARLADRVNAIRDGEVRFSFAAREGVCGNHAEGWHIRSRERNAEWQSECTGQVVRVALTREAARVTSVRTYVGGEWRPLEGRVTDLGTVSPVDAANYLMTLGATADAQPADRAIAAATIAEGADVWRQLLAIARDTTRPRRVQRTATFWLGMQAGERITQELAGLAASDSHDLEVREHAVFAISRRPRDESIPELIRIARGDSHPRVRRSALFWLGQSGDERALALFSELLGGR